MSALDDAPQVHADDRATWRVAIPSAAQNRGNKVPEPKRRHAEHNAGAFYNPSGVGGGIPVPMSTLTDQYRDQPAEPEDSERIPEPEAPGRIRRVVDQLTHRLNP